MTNNIYSPGWSPSDTVQALRDYIHPSCWDTFQGDLGFPPCPQCLPRLEAAELITRLAADRLRLIAMLDHYLCECGDAMPAPDEYECPNCATARWSCG